MMDKEQFEKTILNLSKFHREHEKFYAQNPLEQANRLQFISRVLTTLADRWSQVEARHGEKGNPYIGCEHGCIYCYAEFMKRFTNHHEPWSEFLDVKVNSPDLVKSRGQYNQKIVLLSSVTDPYLPHERKYELTRKILKKLIPHQPQLTILTKSEMVVRDIDLFRQFKNAEVGISVSTLNQDYSKQLEPRASTP